MRLLSFLFFLTTTNVVICQDYSFSEINTSLLKNADAVVRYDQMNVLVKSSDYMEVTSKRAITVLNEKGSKHVNAMAFYDKETSIKSLSAIIYDANGKEVDKFKEKDFIDQTATGEGTLYSDSRVKFLKYTTIKYPYTVVLNKNYTTSDTAFMPRWYFLDGYRVSTEQSEFTLNLPLDMEYRHKENNFDSFKIEGTANKGGLNFIGSNLLALESEDFDPEFRDFTPNIQLALEDFHLKGVDGSAATWKEFGSWVYNSLLKERGELNPLTIQKIRALVKDINDPKEKIKKIYQFVQDNTRYISVQMGIGGWMPISAEEVDRVKYGDCKGLTNYTMALLKAVGIKSYYTIVSADTNMRSLDFDFPSLQGNHAFLNVPLDDEEIWLECTSQIVPVDYLGTFTDDRYVLKVGPNGGDLVKSRQYLPEQSKQQTVAELTIGENRIDAQIKITSTGIQYDQKYRLANVSKNNLEKHYKEYWDYVNGINILTHEMVNDKNQIMTIEKIGLNTSGYLSKAGERLLFAPNMFNRNAYVPKKDANRIRSIVIKRGYLDEDDFTIDFPVNYELESSLKSVEIINDFGEYTVSLQRISDNQIRYSRRLLIKPGVFPNIAYEEYRNFRKTISRVDASKIVFIKTNK